MSGGEFDFDDRINMEEEAKRKEQEIQGRQSSTVERDRGRHSVVCKHWLNRTCMKGEDCDFLHARVPSKMPECETYNKYGKCNGYYPDNPEKSTCEFKHISREDRKLCDQYRWGFCPLGPQCRRRHDRLPRDRVPEVVPDWFLTAQLASLPLQAGGPSSSPSPGGGAASPEEGEAAAEHQTKLPEVPPLDPEMEAKLELEAATTGGAGGGGGQQQIRDENFSSSSSSPLPPGIPFLPFDPETTSVCGFIIKSHSMTNIETSIRKGVWATTRANTQRLETAFFSERHVLLLFSANESGGFQGYARMGTRPRRDLFPGLWGEFSSRLGSNFRVQWLKQCQVSFEELGPIRNPLNENKPLKKSRDGQELPAPLVTQICRHLARSADVFHVGRPVASSAAANGEKEEGDGETTVKTKKESGGVIGVSVGEEAVASSSSVNGGDLQIDYSKYHELCLEEEERERQRTQGGGREREREGFGAGGRGGRGGRGGYGPRPPRDFHDRDRDASHWGDRDRRERRGGGWGPYRGGRGYNDDRGGGRGPGPGPSMPHNAYSSNYYNYSTNPYYPPQHQQSYESNYNYREADGGPGGHQHSGAPPTKVDLRDRDRERGGHRSTAPSRSVERDTGGGSRGYPPSQDSHHSQWGGNGVSHGGPSHPHDMRGGEREFRGQGQGPRQGTGGHHGERGMWQPGPGSHGDGDATGSRSGWATRGDGWGGSSYYGRDAPPPHQREDPGRGPGEREREKYFGQAGEGRERYGRDGVRGLDRVEETAGRSWGGRRDRSRSRERERGGGQGRGVEGWGRDREGGKGPGKAYYGEL